MKLIRFGQMKKEKPGILTDSGQRKDCSQAFDDWNHDFLINEGLSRLAEHLEKNGRNLPDVPADTRWGACIARPGKTICIGLNYRKHAAESGSEVPKEPMIFMKATNSVVGPYDNILIPRGSKETDWEVELGIVIGKEARYLDSMDEARNHIAGYCLCNDVSERSFQRDRAGQWTKGKSCDNFNPVGPLMATVDEIPDVKNLPLRSDVNGQRMQHSNTNMMVFDPFYLVHYLSQFMTLEPGDLICSGTPDGVGMGRTPPLYLKAGDEVELAIEGLGEQKQICIDA